MSNGTSPGSMPTPERIFETLNAYQRTAALKSAIELDLFTPIGDGADTAAAIAQRCKASERGIRILCDTMTIGGLLTKKGDRYALTPDAAVFLSKKSPAYLGTMIGFMSSPALVRNFDHLTQTIRTGTVPAQNNTVTGEEQELWVDFARSMAPMMAPVGRAIGDLLQIESAGPVRILDIAAGHGIFGLSLAQRNPKAEVVAVDWPGVLAVADENAKKLGVEKQFRKIPGDAFSVDYGRDHDIALMTNFLHHYDIPTCTTLLRKVAGAMKPGGRLAILEFVPNDDRVTPPAAAAFSLTMLAGTPGGDAYTLAELRRMSEDAGFRNVAIHSLPSPQNVITATRP
jgi:2-polyprenyl-3-methyl-5-hydroxy-6-metoxy-1,4-benzoquinol methylase